MTGFTHSTGDYLQVDDASIYFETAGNPNGRPILLLHGGLGSLKDFNRILEKCPTQFKLIGVDLRGHGKSTMGSAPLNYARYQSDVEAVLAHLSISCVSILGFSDGGIVGYRMAAKGAPKVEQLITLGSQWRLTPDDPSLPLLSNMTSEKWYEMYPDSVSHYNKINPQANFDALVAAVADVWTDMQSTGYPCEAVTDIQCPVLIVRGDEDELLSLSESGELVSRIEGSRFFNIPFAGHAAYEHSADIFCNVINEFLIYHRNKA